MSTDDVNARQYVKFGEGVEVIADNDDLRVIEIFIRKTIDSGNDV